jgi:transposase
VRMTTVFKMLLNLQDIRVRAVRFDQAEQTIGVAVEPTARKHRCPQCKFSTRGRYDSDLRHWRHVALGCWRIELKYQICRLACPEHGVITEEVPWAQPRCRFTTDFEDLVAWTARTMDKTAVTRLLHISWATVGDIIERVVHRKLDPDRLNHLYVIGVDEVSYRKGHKYLTIIADHLQGRPVFITKGRTQESVKEFFKELGPERAKELAAVSMDMAAPYIAEVRAQAPNAEIAFDPFHVVKLGNEAVQEVRRSEVHDNKDLPAAKILKDARWSLLRASEAATDKDQLRLSEVAALNKPVYRAYLLKEELRALYSCPMEAAESHLDSWLSWASRSQLAPFVRVAKTIRTNRDGVLAAIRLGLSNGRLEGINNKVGVIKRRAFGFHSAGALIAMIFLCCSNLPITLPI